jgi:hypothetical protein
VSGFLSTLVQRAHGEAPPVVPLAASIYTRRVAPLELVEEIDGEAVEEAVAPHAGARVPAPAVTEPVEDVAAPAAQAEPAPGSGAPPGKLARERPAAERATERAEGTQPRPQPHERDAPTPSSRAITGSVEPWVEPAGRDQPSPAVGPRRPRPAGVPPQPDRPHPSSGRPAAVPPALPGRSPASAAPPGAPRLPARLAPAPIAPALRRGSGAGTSAPSAPKPGAIETMPGAPSAPRPAARRPAPVEDAPPERLETILVSIGRVEVRAPAPRPGRPTPPPAPRGPSQSLDDYLSERDRSISQ